MSERKEVTIYDIAKALNISASTVSRGLRGHPAINKKTVRKIKEAALSMGYQQNTFARNLRRNRSNTIGVILPRLDSNFQSLVVSGIEKQVNAKGFNLIISQSRESVEKEAANVTTMFNSRVDGLLISLACDTCSLNHLDLFLRKGIPVILFDRVKEHADFQFPQVVIDNVKAGYDATRHLIEQGCKRIMYVGDNLMSNVYSQRHEGYRKALKENNLPYDPDHVIITTLDDNSGVKVVDRMKELAEWPDGVFAANDTSAVSIISRLKNTGMRIPEEIAVVGFNNVLISRVVDPPLTTIHYPGVEIGEVAAKTLIDMMKGEETVIMKTIILDHKLIIRESSRRKASGD